MKSVRIRIFPNMFFEKPKKTIITKLQDVVKHYRYDLDKMMT